MTQTFDIRFARSAGLAAILETPENVFRWKGDGQLQIDDHGISIGVKRGLHALFGGKRVQRIPAGNLRAVYREGDALRVEFQTDDTRVVVPFWTNDRETAARIVQLLPTRETVEIELSTDGSQSARLGKDLRVLALLGVGLLAIIAVIWTAQQRNQPPQVAVPDLIDAPNTAETPALSGPSVPADVSESIMAAGETPAGTSGAPPSTPEQNAALASAEVEPPFLPMPNLPGTASPTSSTDLAQSTSDESSTWRASIGRATPDGIVPFTRGTLAHTLLRAELAKFRSESRILREEYTDILRSPSVERLKTLEERWWNVTIRVSEQAPMVLMDIELAVSRAWRRALSMHAQGLVSSSPEWLSNAAVEVDFAEMLEDRAHQFAP